MTWEVLWPWLAFNGFVLAMLALDLGVFHRTAHAVSLKEAGIWSAVWIALALVFNAGIYLWKGQEPALQFLAGYLIEKSLSVDNIFVFVLIFGFFAVPAPYQHRVLFWGIIGALLMRGAFIAAGAALLAKFHWIIYVFGAFLVVTGIKMALVRSDGIHPEKNPLVRLARKLIPVTGEYHGQNFVVRKDGRWWATPLLLVLLVVESTDLVFAVDSIPAIFAITSDPFIVYTSNVFAILGLRSLYFLLGGVVEKFHYLKLGLSVVLAFVGVKMLLTDVAKVPIGVSLGVIAAVIGVSIVVSIARNRRLAAANGA
ncbi:MAG: TerC family protein [Acidobacteriota bacterium]